MDDLALLKDMADRTPLRSDADLTPARNRLLTAIATPAADPSTNAKPHVAEVKAGQHATEVRAGPSVIGKRRPRRRLVVSAAVTVGLAAAITGVVALGGLETVGVAPPTADAAEILHQAADAVRTLPDTPPRPDQFIYTKTHRTHGTVREAWLSADGLHDGLISQDGNDIPLPGCRDGKIPVYKGPEPLPGQFESCTPSPAHRTDLPTDVAGMREYLSQDTGGKPGQEEDVSGLIHFAFAETYVPPASLAALFEAIADFPGLTVDDNAVDGAGRPGIGVSWTRIGQTQTLVFDRQTHAFLGIAGQDAVLEQGIVDAPKQRP